MSAIPSGDGRVVGPDELVLVTGATGFVGLKVVESLLNHGLRNLRCLVRHSSHLAPLDEVRARHNGTAQIEIQRGDLLSREDCVNATRQAALVYHLAVGAGSKSYPDLFMHSVVTTRNLLEGCLEHRCLRRFVNVSSFSVYTNCGKPRGRVLDESCPVETKATLRGDAYCFAKVKQDQLVTDYGAKHGIPYIIVRPGVVYGPGKKGITGRVGIGTFGIFLHLGGSNAVPLTYVDNCADAIARAGLTPGVDGEVINVVDDDLPSSRRILRLYKRGVERFKSVYLPRPLSYLFFWAWESYSRWSEGQLPPTLNRKAWRAFWKGATYDNSKLKRLLGWTPRVSTAEGLRRYVESCREDGHHD